jgi:hypothetical protein
MRVRDGAGAERLLIIEVPAGSGEVRASLGTTAIALTPQDVSRLRDLYLQAQAVAMQDRGEW